MIDEERSSLPPQPLQPENVNVSGQLSKSLQKLKWLLSLPMAQMTVLVLIFWSYVAWISEAFVLLPLLGRGSVRAENVVGAAAVATWAARSLAARQVLVWLGVPERAKPDSEQPSK